MVLDFGFSKCWLWWPWPINWFCTLIDVTFFSHLTKDTNLSCFIIWCQSNIWVIPISRNTKTFEIFTLFVNLWKCIITTHLKVFSTIKFFTFHTLFCQHLLNWKTMRIPTRNVRSIETRHWFWTHNDILRNFIHRMSNVNITIGIGRTIMKSEVRFTLVQLLTTLIHLSIFPLFLPDWFFVRKSSSHWKGCLT